MIVFPLSCRIFLHLHGNDTVTSVQQKNIFVDIFPWTLLNISHLVYLFRRMSASHTHVMLCLSLQEDECRPYTRDVMFIFTGG